MPGRTCVIKAVENPSVDSWDVMPVARDRKTSGPYNALKATTTRFGISSLSIAIERSMPYLAVREGVRGGAGGGRLSHRRPHLSFPKIPSARIRAMRQNQRIMMRDACIPSGAWDV